METSVEPRRHRQRRELETGIVTEAIRQLREGGTQAISLRGIARALGVSAPSIYTYFSSLTELVTELIVRCNDSLAEELRKVTTDQISHSLEQQLIAGPMAYREWAIAHRQEFNLIFFDQIIGYSAPEDGKTVRAQSEMLHVLAVPFAKLRGCAPSELLAENDILDEFLGWWGSFHGLVALEVNHHFDWRDPKKIFMSQIQSSVGGLLRLEDRARPLPS